MIAGFLKKYYPIILLAIIVGALTAAPEFFIRQKLADGYQGIYRVLSDDEPYYLTRGREIKDGHVFLANTYLAEHKNSHASQFWLPDYLLAKPLAWLGVGAPAGYAFYDFCWPAVLTIFIYIIFWLLTGSRFFSLAGTSLAQLGIFLADFNRSPSPQFIFIFWLTLFILLLNFLCRPGKKYLILAALNLGLLFYIYPYYWMFYLVFIVLLVAFSRFKNKNFNWRPWLYLLAGALIIALTYFISVAANLKNPIYNESLSRIGLIATHFPSGLKIVFLSLVIIILTAIFYKKKIINLEQPVIFLISANLAAALAANQHVVTGRNLEFSSHFLMISQFCFMFSLVYLSQALMKFFSERFRQAAKVLIILTVISAVAFNINQVLAEQTALSEQDYYRQRYAPIFSWLDRNAEKDQAVFANSDISCFLPAYTANNVFYCPAIVLSSMADREVAERFIINNYWEDFSREFVEVNQRALWGTRYLSAYNHNLSKNKFRKILGLEPVIYQKLPEEQISAVIALAKNLQSDSFEKSIKKYQADYLVWDKNRDPNWQIDDQDFLQPLFEVDNIIIYKIN